ncbi:SprT family zinc-dependent metalloprotease [Marinomonas sp. C1424]|uniref:SprT family zinc-dependent metalloprotease n=2 Tax=Marinomonas transparens TaxID=2795388 RepID=A0A934N6N8_9GAMM|nr:SprT family zinc-dependent metalloprotease [Marinomonas transparens]
MLKIGGEEMSPLDAVSTQVSICFDKADTFFKSRFRRSSCDFSQRGRAAGTAHLHKNQIRFNPFMYNQNPQAFLESVVPHEVAHMVVYQIYGLNVKPHGKEWQAVMRKVFGLSPNRTHTFEVPPPKQAFEYHCACQTHQFTKRRHSKAQKGTEYICKLCQSSLKFSIEILNTK